MVGLTWPDRPWAAVVMSESGNLHTRFPYRTGTLMSQRMQSMLFCCQLLVTNLVVAAGCTTQVEDSSYVPPGSGEEIQLEHGYTRIGKYILFKGKRIDKEGAHDLDRFARLIPRKLKLASNVDAASFAALSNGYTKDKNMVYYKWISPGRFWVCELPEADPETFESVAFNLAKDKTQVWWYGNVLRDLDPKTLTVLEPGFVWKDKHAVWYQHKKILEADPNTFAHIGQGFYKDKDRVYWSSTPLDGADPRTFRVFDNEVAFGADKNAVWRATKRMPGMDAATFGVVHQQVYKDKTGVYCNGALVPGARPESIRKLADLDEHLTALLTDGDAYFVYVALWNEVYRVEPQKSWLRVSKDVYEGKQFQQRRIGDMSALLTALGWQKLRAPESKRLGKNFWEQREAQTLTQHKPRFKKAWEIITGEEKKIGESKQFARIMNTPVEGDYKEPTAEDFAVLQTYRATQRKFDSYYRRWLDLNPAIKEQIESGKSIDVAEAFAVEMFGLADSKMPMAELLGWKDVGTKLALDLAEINRRSLRPPAPECALLRDELIRQAAEMLGDKLPEGKDAEDVIDAQIDKWRIHYPLFLMLEPADEKQLRTGKSIRDSSTQIKAAREFLADYEVRVGQLTKHLLDKHRVNQLTPVQQELLAQLITAEMKTAEAALTK